MGVVAMAQIINNCVSSMTIQSIHSKVGLYYKQETRTRPKCCEIHIN